MTGLGKVPALTFRQRVADENGKMDGISVQQIFLGQHAFEWPKVCKMGLNPSANPSAGVLIWGQVLVGPLAREESSMCASL